MDFRFCDSKLIAKLNTSKSSGDNWGCSSECKVIVSRVNLPHKYWATIFTSWLLSTFCISVREYLPGDAEI